MFLIVINKHSMFSQTDDSFVFFTFFGTFLGKLRSLLRLTDMQVKDNQISIITSQKKKHASHSRGKARIDVLFWEVVSVTGRI